MPTNPDASIFSIDESAAPLIVVTFPTAGSADDIPELFAAYHRIATQHPRVAWIVDLRAFNPILAPAKVRRAFADHYEQNRKVIEASAICEARIFGSSVMCGVVTAIDWLVGRAYPSKNFGTLVAARDWARSMLEQPADRSTAR